MANELTTVVNCKYNKNGVEIARNIGNSVSVSGSGLLHNVQYVGTSEEALIMRGCGNPGLSSLQKS